MIQPLRFINDDAYYALRNPYMYKKKMINSYGDNEPEFDDEVKLSAMAKAIIAKQAHTQ